MDTWGAELHPALDVPTGTAIVRKGSNGEDGYSGFTMRDPAIGRDVPTMLEPLLQAAGVEEVVVVGLATDYCVKATALDAIRLGFRTTVLTDAIAAVERRRRATASGRSTELAGGRRRCSARAGCAERDAASRPRPRVAGRHRRGQGRRLGPPPCRRRGRRSPEPMRMLVVVDAPIERGVARPRRHPAPAPLDARDEGGPRHRPRGPTRVGTRGEATVRIFGVAGDGSGRGHRVRAAHRFAIRHEGLFTGGGVITLEPGADGTTTVVRWEETLIPPLPAGPRRPAPGPPSCARSSRRTSTGSASSSRRAPCD